MPRTFAIAAALGVSVALASSALADHRPAFVLPDRGGVPLMVDGVDVNGAYVEGDWGLHRPGAGRVTVVPAYRPRAPWDGGYYPFTGRQPGYGRYEIEPPLRPPRPAPAYRRSWSTDGISRPDAPAVAADPPVVIEAPIQYSREPREYPRQHQRRPRREFR